MVQSPNWPDWWSWELDCTNPHLQKRMTDRGFSETDLRGMLEVASGFRRDPAVLGRFIIETMHGGARWEAVVEPQPAEQVLLVVTAYRVA
jgi:hypothetical protein